MAKRCPKSLITAASIFYLELFHIWKEGGGSLLPMDAKSADALLLLEKEWKAESQHGN